MDSAPIKGKNGKTIFSDKLAEDIIQACASGFSVEKAGALLGIPPSTIKTWCARKPAFAVKVESARKKHELSLLRDVQTAGDKSWQAKAWILERTYNYCQPSARLQVSASHEHNLGGNLAQLLAGVASRRREKQAQAIDLKEVKQISAPQSKDNNSKDNNYYATFDESLTINKSLPDNNLQNQQKLSDVSFAKLRNKRMRKRKPRAESLAKYPPRPPHPLPTSPAPILNAYTPPSNSATKQKEDVNGEEPTTPQA